MVSLEIVALFVRNTFFHEMPEIFKNLRHIGRHD